MCRNSSLFVVAISIFLIQGNINQVQAAMLGGSKLFVDREVTAGGKELIHLSTSSLKNPFRSQFGDPSRIVKKADRSTGDMILDLAVIYWIDQDNYTLSYLKDWCKEAIKVEQWGNNNDLSTNNPKSLLKYVAGIVGNCSVSLRSSIP